MIVLDTNVLSELVRPVPDPHVLAWVDAQNSADLMITALTAAETRTGIALLPDGQRRRNLQQHMESLLSEVFNGQVLAFDTYSSSFYAEIVASRRRIGRPISVFDAQIAAICRQYGAPLATRNTDDFADTAVELINPWDHR